MNTETHRITTVEKEMGITHQDFYAEFSNLLKNSPYQKTGNIIRFRYKEKEVEISLGPEAVRQIGPSVCLPVTHVTLRFSAFTEEEVSDFIKHFNLKFMKGGG
jgi:hypothetical protein